MKEETLSDKIVFIPAEAEVAAAVLFIEDIREAVRKLKDKTNADKIIKLNTFLIVNLIEEIKAYEISKDLKKIKHRKARDFKEELIEHIEKEVPKIIAKIGYDIFEELREIFGEKLCNWMKRR